MAEITKKKKTPSARVLAAKHLHHLLHGTPSFGLPPADEMTRKWGSRISAEKREKIKEQVEKLTKSLLARVVKIDDKYEGAAKE